jgi:WD40 repeat protein
LENNHLRVYTAADFEPLPNFENSPLVAEQVAFSPDGKLLAATSKGAEELSLIEVSSGQVVRRFVDPEIGVAHERRVSCLEFSPDGALLISGSPDQRLKIWDIPTGQLAARCSLPDEGFVWPALHPSGDLLAAAAENSVRLFDMRGATEQNVLAIQAYRIRGFDLNDLGDKIAIAFQRSTSIEESTLVIWDVPRQQQTDEWRVKESLLNEVTVAVNQGGNAVAVADDHGGDFWIARTGKVEPRPLAAEHPQVPVWDSIRHVLWGAARGPIDNGTGMVGQISSFDASSERVIARWQNLDSQRRMSKSTITCLSVGRRLLIAGSHDESVKIFECKGHGELRYVASAKLKDGYPSAVALSKDEQLIVAGTTSGALVTIRASDGVITSIGNPHHEWVTAIALDNGGTLAATGAKDRQLVLWRRVDGQLKQLLTLRVPTRVLRLEFAPDGRRLLVLLHGESALRVWRVDQLQSQLAAIGLGW